MKGGRASNLREQLEPAVIEWAIQLRRAWTGEDGWTPRTVLSRVMEEGAGASHTAVRQRVFETFSGDGLVVRRAIVGMPYAERAVLHVHYLANGNATSKAAVLGVSKSAYWAALDRAYFYIAGRLKAVEA